MVEPLDVDYGTAQFDLLWNFAETDAGLALDLRFNTDLFEAATIEQWLRCWATNSEIASEV